MNIYERLLELSFKYYQFKRDNISYRNNSEDLTSYQEWLLRKSRNE